VEPTIFEPRLKFFKFGLSLFKIISIMSPKDYIVLLLILMIIVTINQVK